MAAKIYPIAVGDVSNDEYNNFKAPEFGVFIGAIKSGEFRCPKKGEWFISGAIPQAYKAPNNLSMEYHIAKLISYRKRTRYEIVE